MISFDENLCRNFEMATTREWLETNGLGGYASSTIVNLNTRRYHGLLVAATKPPVGRLVMLSKLEETLVVDGRRYELSSNRYPGVIHPRGYQYQTGFRLDPCPVFTYRIEGIDIEKSVLMLHGENTIIVQYKFRPTMSGVTTDNDDADLIPHPSSLIPPTTPHPFRDPSSPIHFELRPLVAVRDYHSLAHENARFDTRFESGEQQLAFKPYEDAPALHIAHDASSVEKTGDWYRNFEYEVERARGFDFTEDLFCPVVFNVDLSLRRSFSLVASTEKKEVNRVDDYRRVEVERRYASHATAPDALRVDDGLVTSLAAAAEAYVVARGNQQTVIAGYHWFSDWGRDTMIALPGLTLATRRFDVARGILSEFARHVDQGMLPNRFPDAGETPEYNTVDATLWYFEAVRAYLHYTNDDDFVRLRLYDVLRDIITWHVRGTRYGIRVDEDGLLRAGVAGVQLTWMDAKVGDWVVTPRTGKPVEIQALWYHALRVMESLAGKFSDTTNASMYAGMAERARARFEPMFWNEAAGCLYDVVDGEMRDASIRPNQIFAVSLSNSMLSTDKSRRIIEVVRRDLLTSFGLRTLAPTDPRYCGRYAGDSLSRDGAYHQGTVWAWLMGAFITAHVKLSEDKQAARGQARVWLAGFNKHLSEAGLGHVSEIFDGDPPHAPQGCIAQAWSVAELLRAAVEDVYPPDSSDMRS
ncbi:MAG: glycogen debranching enzyme N-terminal domain-containing protein [Acidobacteriota bacterium]|nr:glycogen debranching enzyme N-terminal domain-containing protein [Acidobacteriota bacterium]